MPKKSRFDVEEDEHHLSKTPSTSSASFVQKNRRCSLSQKSNRTHERRRSDDRSTKAMSSSAARDGLISPKGELKGLQDSLTQYFTPSEIRRPRRATMEQPLEISIEDNFSTIKGVSSTESFRSSKSDLSSPKSPRRRDKLEDSLSHYYMPNPNKRRLHKEGEYWKMSRGDAPTAGAGKGENLQQQHVGYEIGKKEAEALAFDEMENDRPVDIQTTTLTASRSSLSLQLPKDEVIIRQKGRKLAVLKRKDNAAAIKSAQLVRKAYQVGKRDKAHLGLLKSSHQPVSSSLKKTSASVAATATSLKNMKNYFRPLKPVTGIAQNGAYQTTKYINILDQITNTQKDLFEQARASVQQELEMANNELRLNENKIFPPKIRIHCYEIDTWYSSPYPQEYAYLPVLHICDKCLLFTSEADSHPRRCKYSYPPGNEVYRDINFSIFEVDGNLARIYCRNLCLLAKLFIDHKTLYFEVEPFLFYVLTLNDSTGCHFVGYFSKEKYSSQKCNLACIMTLPCYQGKGFGRLLIDFSYLLSRREGLAGSGPERPLSTLGKIAYHRYWLSVMFEYFHKKIEEGTKNGRIDEIRLREISTATGIAAYDIVETLAENRMLSNAKDSITSIVLDERAIQMQWERTKPGKARIWLDENRLKWNPKAYSPSKECRLRSPSFSLSGGSSPRKLTLQGLTLQENDVAQIPPETEEMDTETTLNKKKRGSKTATPAVNRRIPPAESAPKTRRDRSKNKTPKVTLGKVGRKKVPGKETSSREKQQQVMETDNDDDFPGTSQQRRGKSAGNCKEPTNRRNQRDNQETSSSTDDDDSHLRKSAIAVQQQSIASAQPSSSSTGRQQEKGEQDNNRSERKDSSKGNCVVSKRGAITRKRQRRNKGVQQGYKEEEEEQESHVSFANVKTELNGHGMRIYNANKDGMQQGRQRAKLRKESKEGGDLSSSAAAATDSSVERPRRHKVLKKRRNLDKRRSSMLACTGESSTQSEWDGEDEKEERKEENTITRSLDLEEECKDKESQEASRRKRSLQLEPHNSGGGGSPEEEEDRSFCSSASPQPMGDRLPIFKPSIIKDHLEAMINMGGEPDTVNMGGEPDDEDIGNNNNNAATTNNSFSTVGVCSYKAPVLISHNLLAEAEDEMEEDQPPTFFRERLCLIQTQSRDQEQQQSSLQYDSGKNNSEGNGIGTVVTGTKSDNTLMPKMIPPALNDARKPSYSPSDAATVEMPALDAAEKHISPVECSSHFGEEEEPVDDDIPPMLSPQQAAANLPPSNEHLDDHDDGANFLDLAGDAAEILLSPTTTTTICPAAAEAATMDNDESFKAPSEQNQTTTSSADLHNTSSSSLDISGHEPNTSATEGVVNNSCSIIICAGQNGGASTTPETTELMDQQTTVTITSDYRKSSTPIAGPICEKMATQQQIVQENANNHFVEPILPSSSIDQCLTIPGLHSKHNQFVPAVTTPENHFQLTHDTAQQFAQSQPPQVHSQHFATPTILQTQQPMDSYAMPTVTFAGPLLYGNQQQPQQQQNFIGPMQQQLAKGAVMEKGGAKSSSKRSKEKSSSAKADGKNQKNSSAKTSSHSNHQQHAFPPSAGPLSTAAGAVPATVTALNTQQQQWFAQQAQMLAVAQQYYQHQPPNPSGSSSYPQQPMAATTTSTMSQQQQQMNYAHWQYQWSTWQKIHHAATAYQQQPIPPSYDQFFGGIAAVNPAAMVAPSYPWTTTGFGNFAANAAATAAGSRHLPPAASQSSSGGNFYSHHHQPPM